MSLSFVLPIYKYEKDTLSEWQKNGNEEKKKKPQHFQKLLEWALWSVKICSVDDN